MFRVNRKVLKDIVSEKEEREIVDGLVRRERASLTELHRIYHPLLRLQVLRSVRDPSVADALIQETMFHVWTHVKLFNRGSDSIGVALVRIAQSRVADYLEYGRFRVDVSSQQASKRLIRDDEAPGSLRSPWSLVQRLNQRSHIPFEKIRERLGAN
jgi:DNA-directed RNA polymerase specialized sigma24 family protein